jgi:hypothetical protein
MLPLTQRQTAKLNATHRKQLKRTVLQIFYPNSIGTERIYTILQIERLTNTIRRQRWKLLGNILRNPSYPSYKVMEEFFSITGIKKRPGRNHTSIYTILRDEALTAHQPGISYCKFKTSSDLRKLARKARNKTLWTQITDTITRNNHDK